MAVTARAYTTSISGSDQWMERGLDIASIPAEFVSSYTIEDVLGELQLDPSRLTYFDGPDEARDMLVEHFARYGLADLVQEAFEQPLVITEESAGSGRSLDAVAAAGAIAVGFAVFGPWAIVAVPAGVFLLAAAPEAGAGFGAWVGRWFRGRQ